MERAENFARDLSNKGNIFGLENRRQSRQIIDEDK
jgi:hypothetical protein